MKPKCPRCGSRNNFKKSKDHNGKQRYKCKDCGLRFTERYGYNDALPKILTFDIETSPNIGAFWSPWKTNIFDRQIIRSWHLLTWSAKWLGGEKIMHDRLTGKEAIKGDDKRITRTLRDLMDEADIVIAHNGKKFDVKRLNTRMLINDVNQPSPYRIIDTLKEIRKRFAFNHNSLDALVKNLEINDGKIETDFQLWMDCIHGNEKALKKMDTYCQNDVLILEELYLHIRGWIVGHPNVALFSPENKPLCHVCGSDNLRPASGEHITQVGVYKTYQCKDCGAFSKNRTTELSLKKRKSLLNAVPLNL